jgi:hypothetical protein
MRWFGRKRRPEWAGFMSESQYHAFEDDLLAVAKEMGLPFRFDVQNAVWQGPRGNSGGLINLAQATFALDAEDRRAEMAAFFGTLLAVPLDHSGIDWQAARSLLKLRFYPLDLEFPTETVTFPVAHDFRTALVLDHPQYVSSVPRSQAAPWGRPDDELFSVALENTWDPEITLEEAQLQSGLSVTVASGGFFAASHSLLIDRWMPEPPDGWLAIVPTRDVLVFTAFDPATLDDDHAQLAPMAADVYSHGPGSVSPEVFRLVDRKFVRIA